MVTTLRSFQDGDEKSFLQLVNTAHSKLENLSMERVEQLTSSPRFNRDGFFIAEQEGAPVGCVGVFTLPSQRHLEIRYLAVIEAFSNLAIIDQLIEAALEYSDFKQREPVKATTLTNQPYLEAYQRFGFKPVRRMLRFGWDTTVIPREEPSHPIATIVEISPAVVHEASQVYLDGLRPYWDWWVEEEGGDEAVVKDVADSMKSGNEVWLGAKVENKIVGVTGVLPNAERDEAWFWGVAVLPSFRMKGVGTALMNAALSKTRELGCKRLYLTTIGYLDSLTPAAILYLKSGGKIDAEYVHLIREPLKARPASQ